MGGKAERKELNFKHDKYGIQNGFLHFWYESIDTFFFLSLFLNNHLAFDS